MQRLDWKSAQTSMWVIPANRIDEKVAMVTQQVMAPLPARPLKKLQTKQRWTLATRPCLSPRTTLVWHICKYKWFRDLAWLRPLTRRHLSAEIEARLKRMKLDRRAQQKQTVMTRTVSITGGSFSTKKSWKWHTSSQCKLKKAWTVTSQLE